MLTRRHVEVATGLVLAGLGAITAYGSLENGTGWTDFGPAAGYFPFRIGLLLVVLGLVIAVKHGLTNRQRVTSGAVLAVDTESAAPALLHGASGLDTHFFEPGALGRIAAVFVPTAVCAAFIPWLGLYIAGTLFLVFSIVTLGKVPLAKAVLIAVATMAATFVLFEFWFQVPLAKGVLMPLLGIH
jgi:hypothetical protein